MSAPLNDVEIVVEQDGFDIVVEGDEFGDELIVIGVGGPGGPPGPAGPAGGAPVRRVAATALGGHRLVVPRDDGQVIYADASLLEHASRPVWLTTAAWSSGATADLTASGIVVESSWSWTPGRSIYVGLDGLLTQTVPASAAFARKVADVVSSSTIQVDVSAPIILT